MTLDDWLRINKISDAEFARTSGIGLRHLIGRYRRGISRPSFKNIARIISATNGSVTADDFVDFPSIAPTSGETA